MGGAHRRPSIDTLRPRPWTPPPSTTPAQYLLVFAAVSATAAANAALAGVAGPRVPGLVFLLLIVVLALAVGRGPVLLAATLSAAVWNFFFLPPRLTLSLHDPHDTILLLTYFVVALVMGTLVARLRTEHDAERQREERATALYELTRDLAGAVSGDEAVWHVLAHVARLFGASGAVLVPDRGGLHLHPDSVLRLEAHDIALAEEAFRSRRPAGATNEAPASAVLHFPLTTDRGAFGVLSIRPRAALPEAQRELLEVFAQQSALALDRADLREAAARTRLLAESERLSRALLDSISHELRTPISAITAAVASLADAEGASVALRRDLLGEIEEASARLNRIVGNLLDLARLEHGDVHARTDWHDARDLVQTTVADLARELAPHPVTVHVPSTPVIARFDFTLTWHALRNLLLNASVHTPAGTPIDVRLAPEPGRLVFVVADAGPGIPAGLMPRLFDKFTRAEGAPAGGSGMGLAIAQGFVEIQRGRLLASNRPGGGAEFRIELEQGEQAPPVDGPA